MIVKTWSGNRIGVVWYDNLIEAEDRSNALATDIAVLDANIGIAQCGRDPARDTEVDGRPAYAVVVP
jgi:hypothetical protein